MSLMKKMIINNLNMYFIWKIIEIINQNILSSQITNIYCVLLILINEINFYTIKIGKIIIF